jgi:hypothetical protein
MPEMIRMVHVFSTLPKRDFTRYQSQTAFAADDKIKIIRIDFQYFWAVIIFHGSLFYVAM